MSASRPHRYTPGEVHKASLACLHSHLRFQRATIIQTDKHPDFDCARASSVFYQFQRGDGRGISYFQTVQDAANNQLPYFTLAEWLETYKNLISSRHLSPYDLVFFPLVLIQDGREHFTSLCFHAEKSRESENLVLRVYLIDPRPNNIFMPGFWVRTYPVTSIFDTIKAGLAGFIYAAIKPENIMLGLQPLLNNHDCGPHHVNIIEMLSLMPDAILEHAGNLSAHLCCTMLERRNNDSDYISQFPDEEAEQDEAALDSAHHALNEKFHPDYQQLFTLAEEKLQSYIMREPSYHIFGGAHTRHHTAAFILRLLTAMRDKTPSITLNVCIAAQLLYDFYVSINSATSELAESMESALVLLLECQQEHKAIIRQVSNPADRYTNARQVFHNRLVELKAAVLFNEESYRLVRPLIEEINAADTRFSYKLFLSSREFIDGKRSEWFDQITLALDQFSSQQYLPHRP